MSTTTPTKASKKFRTPHEQKAADKTSVAKSKAAPADAKGRDAFGGRIGTRMSKINLVVINAGDKGATIPEVAKTTGESTSIVSAQLGWIVSQKKLATRKEEKDGGKKTFRYFIAQ